MKTGWNKCLLRQEVTSEILRCPAESRCLDVGAGKGYSTLSLNITRFSELNELPMPIDLRQLDEGNGVEAKEHSQMAQILSLKIQYHKVKAGRKEKNLLQKEVTWIPPLGSTLAKVAFLWQTKLIYAFFVRLCHHQNCSMKCQPFTWTVVFRNVHLF